MDARDGKLNRNSRPFQATILIAARSAVSAVEGWINKNEIAGYGPAP